MLRRVVPLLMIAGLALAPLCRARWIDVPFIAQARSIDRKSFEAGWRAGGNWTLLALPQQPL